jgi:hypothetical protein
MNPTRQPKTKAQPPAKAPAAKTEAKGPRGVISRAGKGDVDRITAYLPFDFGQQVRMACLRRRIELSEGIYEALQAWLTRQD